ncbi:hypothetical protein [Bacillus sp. es.036]|uniref:hypothetical protein n=1 Tax=Bacillus sp. es.036 TaxID=1761764 RepID=UPI000BF6879C|nr:hypothetical protein [Bacillus sp. es.036]PFG15088.1 hypothetical protein ATG70_3338 [Bacillus sp. es.036]
MTISIQEVFSLLKIPTVILTILMIFIKINPITLISSSVVEMRVATKEKRFLITTIRTIGEILFYTLIVFLITDSIFKNYSVYNVYIAIILFIFSIIMFTWMIILENKGITLHSLIENYDNTRKIVCFILFSLSFLNIFFMPAYYFGTKIYSQVALEKKMMENNYEILVILLVIYFLYIVFIYFPVIKTYYNFFSLKNSQTKTISITINSEIWYVFHPINKKFFLIGNNPILNQCTEISFIEKENLFKEVLVVDRVIES